MKIKTMFAGFTVVAAVCAAILTADTSYAQRNNGGGGGGCQSVGGYWVHRRNPGDNVPEKCYVNISRCPCGSTGNGGVIYCEYHTIDSASCRDPHAD